ncbi:lytic transglycosylase [Bacteroidia bacterium]|nr:lytic transglycosylase [Bacteroidia bacterium]
MKKLIFGITFLLAGVMSVNAQYQQTTDTVDEEMNFVPESWDNDFDRLVNSWHIQYYIDKNAHPGYGETVTESDAVYAERLSKLNSIMKLPYNDVVRRCIDQYVGRRRNLVEYMLGVENFYFPMIEQELDKNKLPHELKYLSIVESALNPTAVSRAGATGLWQFMLGTGKSYGLEVNSLVDERRDPMKATQAACAYFKDLYNIYGDWNLVLAAYNCGPGNVNKAIRRAGGSTDYWTIFPYLPRETRLYVPFFIAVNYVMNYYANHQLYPVATTLPIVTDTVVVNQIIHLDQIAETLNLDKELLRVLNPQYKQDIVPGHSQPRTIRLPSLQAYAFVEKTEDVIANHRRDEIFGGPASMFASNKSNSNGSSSERIVHRVKKGETLARLGSKYGVSSASIKKWNKLKSNTLAIGRRLVIYVDNGGITTNTSAAALAYTTPPTTKTSEVTTETSAITTTGLVDNSEGQIEEVPVTEEYQPEVETPKKSATLQYKQYKVQSGDTLYSIAKRSGTTHTKLMRLNGLSKTALRVGQTLKVPKV